MDAPKCRLCGHKHYGVDHVWDATNTKSATNKGEVVATNRANGETTLDQRVIPVAVSTTSAVVDGPERRTPNRRSRNDYNAYQREYMKRRREASAS